MRQQVGCRDLAAAVLAAMLIPWFATHCFGSWVRAGRALAGGVPAAPAAPAPTPDTAGVPVAGADGDAGGGSGQPRCTRGAPPASLEAWVRLRTYRGCPLLVAVAGYRLGLYCRAGGRSDGTLAFAGPFAGRAYLSARPAPLGRWFHVAGLAPGTAGGMLSPVPATPLIVLDGADVTAGRAMGALPPLPLGRDPWPREGARLASPDGELGAWRFSRRPRTVAEVAAGRGAPGRLAPLPATSSSGEGVPATGGGAGVDQRATSSMGRGWLIAGLCLTAALLLVAVALSLPARTAAPPRALGPPSRRRRRQGALP